jgi:dimethylargininase
VLTAFTRTVSESIAKCELTYVQRCPIDYAKAVEQHRAYQRSLEQVGVRVVNLPELPELPDSVFVEDTAVVVDELAVIPTMGALTRRPEVESSMAALKRHRPLRFINHDGTLEGGDVVRVGRTLYVGVSSRTNLSGVRQLRDILEPYGYGVEPVEVYGCLHLSTGASHVGRNTILANPEWVDVSRFEGRDVLFVPESEPWAANTILVGDSIIIPEGYPRTREMLERRDLRVVTVDISELEKAEAGLTCMSIFFDCRERD